MERIKWFFIYSLFPLLAAAAVVYGYDKIKQSQMYLCTHQYALCTSAICVPLPDDHSKAVCFCDVEEGPSMATIPCDEIGPATDSNGIRTVYSAFSLEQFRQGKKGMKCPEGTPWTWCLNKRCTVDPFDATKAICLCDVMRKGEWTTLGGNCDTSACQTGYWSGATIKDVEDGNAFLMNALNLKQSLIKWCPAGI